MSLQPINQEKIVGLCRISKKYPQKEWMESVSNDVVHERMFAGDENPDSLVNNLRRKIRLRMILIIPLPYVVDSDATVCSATQHSVQEMTGRCFTGGAIPKSSGKNIVASGMGMGVISVPTTATRLGRESERTSRLVSGAIFRENSMMSSWVGMFSIAKFSRLWPTSVALVLDEIRVSTVSSAAIP